MKYFVPVITLIVGGFSAISFAAPVGGQEGNHPAVCGVVVAAANLNKLDTLVVPFGNAGVDVNNDGILEKIILNSEGAMHWESLSAFDLHDNPIEIKKSESDDWDGDRLHWALDQLLIKHKGQIYVLGKTGDYLHYLSRMNSKNIEEVVCEFAQRSEPVEVLISSSNDRLCKLALRRELSFVEFNKTHALTSSTLKKNGFNETLPGEYAAQVDINNDNKQELVVKLSLNSGRGRGCDGESLGVLNGVRNDLDKNITDLLPEPECGGIAQTPFLFEGRAYIEMLYPTGHPSNTHRIVQISNGGQEEICKFDVRIVNYVSEE